MTTNSERPFAFKDLLAIRDYRFLWLGQIVSDMGDSMTSLALLLLVNHLTGSTAALATMAIVLALPSLTFGLFAGVIVDRSDRKRVMILSDLLRGLFVLGFVLVDSPQKVWMLYAIGFAQASIATFFNPARGALIPNIVPKKGLLSANSISQTSRIIFGLLGTGLTGFIIGQFEQYWLIFVIDALTFALSLLLISRIGYSHQPTGDGAAINLRLVVSELGEGLKLTFSNRILTGAIVAFAVTMLGIGAVNVLLVPLLINDLQVSEAWFAPIEFSQTAGMVLAGSLVAFLSSKLKVTNILAGGLILLGIVVALMSLPTAVWHIMIILFFAGLCIIPSQASGATIVQTAVPDNVRGRTGSANNAVITTAQLVSMGLAGVAADLIGARNVFILGGAVVSLAGVAALLIFRGADLSLPDEAAPQIEA
ncbi:MAG: MFS transporter [Caldilineaceae bacterium]|nr:MFS transporter [Caldilineaceae bacterium]HRJ42759.1 MFS transporter [Caldilineaceae bacterium]